MLESSWTVLSTLSRYHQHKACHCLLNTDIVPAIPDCPGSKAIKWLSFQIFETTGQPVQHLGTFECLLSASATARHQWQHATYAATVSCLLLVLQCSIYMEPMSRLSCKRGHWMSVFPGLRDKWSPCIASRDICRRLLLMLAMSGDRQHLQPLSKKVLLWGVTRVQLHQAQLALTIAELAHIPHLNPDWTMPGARRQGRPCTAWTDNIKTWTGLSVEESIRMPEDRDIRPWCGQPSDRGWLKNRTGFTCLARSYPDCPEHGYSLAAVATSPCSTILIGWRAARWVTKMRLS